MSEQIDVIKIIENHLTENGFDGLYNDECGCVLGDFEPCGAIQGTCRPGYRHVHSSGAFVVSGKKHMSEDEIQEVLDSI